MLHRRSCLWPVVLLALGAVACGGTGADPGPDTGGADAVDVSAPDVGGEDVASLVDLGPPPNHALLPENVGFDDPILLTVAAPRGHSSYLVDEGYTLARDADGVVAFVTDTAGTFGVAFTVDGVWRVSEDDWEAPLVIEETTSDTIRGRFALVDGVDVTLRFAVSSSAVGALELVLTGDAVADHEIVAIPWLRRCEGGYTSPVEHAGGVRMAHRSATPGELVFIGPRSGWFDSHT